METQTAIPPGTTLQVVEPPKVPQRQGTWLIPFMVLGGLGLVMFLFLGPGSENAPHNRQQTQQSQQPPQQPQQPIAQQSPQAEASQPLMPPQAIAPQPVQSPALQQPQFVQPVPPIATQQYVGAIVKVVAPGISVNLREAPTIHARPIDAVQDGEFVQLLPSPTVRQDGVIWVNIAVRNRQGWISSQFLPTQGVGNARI